MKTCVRIGSLVIALGLAGLFAGCASRQSASYRDQPARDFEVVETSTKRQLSDREMEYLRAKVAEYLTQQGQTGAGDYYVKIYLGEDDGVAKGDWVVVRFSRYPSTRFELMTAYSTSYPSYPRYSYDYYPFGLYGFSSFGFRYYDDPYYYGYTGSYPTWYYPRYRDRNRDRDHDNDRNRPHHGNRPSGALKPSFVPTSTVAERPRWNGTPGSFDDRRRDDRGDNTSRGDSRQRWRDRQPGGSSGQPVNRFVPANTPTSNPGTPNYRPTTRSNLYRERADSGGYQAQPRPERSDEPRSYRGRDRDYSPPVQTRSESRSQDSSSSSSSSNSSPSSYNSSSSNSSSSSSNSSSNSETSRPVFHGGRAPGT